MKTATPYWQKLQHPLWQRKRLEILARDNFECQSCGDTDSMLNVHHSYYEKGLLPWEYPLESLHTLCEQCHEEVERVRLELNRTIGRLGLCGVYSLLDAALRLRNPFRDEAPQWLCDLTAPSRKAFEILNPIPF